MATVAFKGTGVSRGIAIGKVYVLQRSQLKVREYVIPAALIEAEVARFHAALAAARSQLSEIKQRIPAATPVDIVSFIDMHLLMMSDKALTHGAIEILRQLGCNAEWALKLQRDALAAVFDAMEDPYLRTRKDDIDHVVNRIQRVLLAQQDHVQTAASGGGLRGCVIVADDLSPADTVLMQDEGVVAFVTEYGGPTSHTTILARSLGIPAVVGVRHVLRYLRAGETTVVDGYHGDVIVGADERVLRYFHRRQGDEQRHNAELRKLRERPAVSRDGLAVSLQANVELPDDLQAMKSVAAKGVGLYRTEFLFMNRDAPPDEEEQYNTYLQVVRRLNGAPLTIRTLDLGADKTLSNERRAEPRGVLATNPALGLRAIRLCLRDPDLFLPQLRAILRVAAEGPVSMMLPMLSCVQEVQRALELIQQAKRELDRRGMRYDDRITIGGMIEVPAAALIADVFARHLDFLSIGTNDLIQYTMAADRLDNTVNYLYQPLHPAVLRLIQNTLRAGRLAGIPVAMCGEMAGEPRYTRLLLGLGLREFSMQPASIPEIKRIIQNSDIGGLTRRVMRIGKYASAVALEAFADRLNLD